MITMKLMEEVRKGRYEIELDFTLECYELASEYIKKGIIPLRYEDDAFHIAVVSVNNVDAIISWNFKHIVKLKTKKEVLGVNTLMGYKEIEIYSPLEVIWMIKEEKSMKEIHTIMERLSRKRSGMSPREVVEDIRKGSEMMKQKSNVLLKKPVTMKKVV
jgi:hypothetical protein